MGGQLAEVFPNSVPTDGVSGNDSQHPGCQGTPHRTRSTHFSQGSLSSVDSFLHVGSWDDDLVLRGHSLCSIPIHVFSNTPFLLVGPILPLPDMVGCHHRRQCLHLGSGLWVPCGSGTVVSGGVLLTGKYSGAEGRLSVSLSPLPLGHQVSV